MTEAITARTRLRAFLVSLNQPTTYLGVAILVFINAGAWYLTGRAREDDYADALRQSENVTQVLQQSVVQVLKATDANLLLLRRLYRESGGTFKLDSIADDPVFSDGQILHFMRVDRSGRVADDSVLKRLIGTDHSNRPYFMALRDGSGDEAYFERPFLTSGSGGPVFGVSRRLVDRNGAFDGVVVAYLNPIVLSKRMAGIDLGGEWVFSLVGFDRTIFVRMLAGKTIVDVAGDRTPDNSGMIGRLAPGASGHYWNGPSVFDGKLRLVVYRSIDPFPMAVAVGREAANIYAQSDRLKTAYSLIAGLLTIAILIAIALGANRERRLRRAVSDLIEAREAMTGVNHALEARVTERTNELAEEVARRKAAQDRLARANEDLEQRVAERTAQLSAEIERRNEAQMTLSQVQKLDAVGQLTAGIAHDFNNLLAVIKGGLEFVEREAAKGLTAEPELIDAALRATRRGRDLVQRLLSFARQAPLRAEPTQIDQLVLDTLRMLRRTLGERIDIVTHLDAPAAIVSVDRNQLVNAILNLAINARDAMPDGGQLTISTAILPATDGAARGQVCLKIDDSGCGMDESVRSRAFEPFFTTKPDGLGSGLGLSMVHGFVEQSGGSVNIDSTPGRGTTITIALPQMTGAAAADAFDNDGAAAPAQQRERTVLLVEDDPDVRIVTSAQLKQLGYKVHAVSNGKEAIDMIASPADIDITLTDVVLPGGIDGVTLIREAMRARPTMGVICMSGYDPTKKHRKWLEIQNIPFIEKPFSSGRLADALDATLAA